MTINYPNPIRDALAHQAERVPPEPSNPAAEEVAQRLDASISEFRERVRGVDPLIDRSLVDLERRSGELDATLREVRRVKHQAATGIIPQRVAETVLTEQAAKIRQDVSGAIKAAEEAFRLGRERLLAEVLPPVGRTHPEAQAAADDLRTVLGRDQDPIRSMETAFKESISEGDEVAVRLLTGTWGRRQFLAKGGTEEAWSALVESWYQVLAKRAQQADPRSREARAWQAIAGRDLPKFLAAAGGRLMFQVDRLR